MNQRPGTRWRPIVVGLVLLLTVWPAAARAENEVVPKELFDKARTEGMARVFVDLAIPTVRETLLDPAAVIAQRQVIKTKQREVLAVLAGTQHEVHHLYDSLPTMSISAGVDALIALNRSAVSNDVLRVAEVRVLSPGLWETPFLIEADQAWADGWDGEGWAVAVIDSGVDKDHIFLRGKVISEACFANPCPYGRTGPGTAVPCEWSTECWHGTRIAGVAAGGAASFMGRNFYGIARRASIVSVRVTSRFTGSYCVGHPTDPCPRPWEDDALRGFEWVYDAVRLAGLRVAAVNGSIGFGTFPSQAVCDQAFARWKRVIDELRNYGVASVFPTGNEGRTNAMWAPACVSSAVSVGATTKDDEIWVEPSGIGSNSAAFLHLLAPGTDMLTPIPGSRVLTGGTGTSLSAPHVAGAWAILKQFSPDASVSAILDALQNSGPEIEDPRNGVKAHRIDVLEAKQYLESDFGQRVPRTTP